MIELDLARMRAEAVLVLKMYPVLAPGDWRRRFDYFLRLPKLAADVLALLGRVEELEYKNSALSWLLGEGGGEIPFRLPDAMEQLRARVAELEAQLIAARAEQVTR